ncbi:MAG: toll/interleukin-1 receptor domain-containing protein [Ruminococcaceae bacterium]|nr:toll/interleukin-1 receptor domain-containing protein [Oscillospiraceae bacterium]
MGYAFISYSTKNQPDADALKQLFNKKGIRTWMAPGDIPVGSKYAQVINHAIKECDCFVLLLTDAAQNSPWVAKEVERAVNYGKTILPIKLEDLVLNEEFEFYISTDQIVAVQKIDEDTDAINKILAGVAAFAGRELLSQPQPAPQLRPEPRTDEGDAEVQVSKSPQAQQRSSTPEKRTRAAASKASATPRRKNGKQALTAKRRMKLGIVFNAIFTVLLIFGFILGISGDEEAGFIFVGISAVPFLVATPLLITGIIGRVKEGHQIDGTERLESKKSNGLTKAKQRMKLGIILDAVSAFLFVLGFLIGFENTDVGAPMILISVLPWLVGTPFLIAGIIGQIKAGRRAKNTEQ